MSVGSVVSTSSAASLAAVVSVGVVSSVFSSGAWVSAVVSEGSVCWGWSVCAVSWAAVVSVLSCPKSAEASSDRRRPSADSIPSANPGTQEKLPAMILILRKRASSLFFLKFIKTILSCFRRNPPAVDDYLYIIENSDEYCQPSFSIICDISTIFQKNNDRRSGIPRSLLGIIGGNPGMAGCTVRDSWIVVVHRRRIPGPAWRKW